MKKERTITRLMACLAAAILFVLPLQAQENRNGDDERERREPRFREIVSPEKSARQATNEMKRTLQLTDKQYDKIYKLNLKEEKARYKAMNDNKKSQGYGRPGMGGPGGRPGMGPSEEELKKMQKAAAKKEKKMKKILTAEQYAKWKKTKVHR